jgi:hypothetical protein
MTKGLSSSPSRSYEPLPRRLCKGVSDVLSGKHSQWVSVSKISLHINVKDEEMLNGAMSFAAQRGWLMLGGQPVHSVLLTEPGQMAVLKKKS